LSKCLGFLVEKAVPGHLSGLAQALQAERQVGWRLLWGNVAASAAVAFTTMEGLLGPWVKEVAGRFFDMAPLLLQGHGSFLSLEAAGRQGWYWERTSCCLNDHLPRGARCRDCSLTPALQRRESYLAELRGDNRG
jgi:ferric iron reductase protein FhuF